MAAITAAVIGAVATAGSIGYQAYQASQTPTGAGANPTFSKLPQDPVSKAMREYWARADMTNAAAIAPSLQSVIASGGDMSKARFPLVLPGMTPNEASALGFTGKYGESIPYVGQAAAAAGQAPGGGGTQLTPEQTLYMAKERAREARAQGQQPGPWASQVLKTSRRLGNVSDRLAALQGIEDPTQQQQRRIDFLTNRQSRLQERQAGQLHGPLPPGTSQVPGKPDPSLLMRQGE